MVDQDRQEQKDAAYECSHGALPHDRVISCGCWPVRTPLAGRPAPRIPRPPAHPRFAEAAARHRGTVGRTSRHHGVSWVPTSKRWRAGVRIDGHTYHLGMFDDEDVAGGRVQEFIRSKTNPTPGGSNVNSDHRERVERFRQQAVVDGDGRPVDDPAVHA